MTKPQLRRQPRPVHHCLAAAALAALNVGAQAQTAEAGKLTTLTVTAERRAENIQEVPNSVSVIGGEVLDVLNTSGQDVRVLSGRVPSLNIESSFGRAFPRFYIRGYGNTDFRLNASQPVSLVYDDVVQENPILKGFPAFDLASIEVLRGPQGTLFGRNTPGGVVKFESVKPQKKFEGYGSLSTGTYQTQNAEVVLNAPMGKDAALRLSILNQTRDDWVDNVGTSATRQLEGYRDTAMRFQFLYEPGKDFSALFNLHARDLEGSSRLFRANIIKRGSNDLIDGFDKTKIANDGINSSDFKSDGMSLKLKFGLGSTTLYSITGYESLQTFNRGDIDGGQGNAFSTDPNIPFSSETADGIPRHRQFTQEFRLESNNPGPLNWQAGAYYFSERYTVESFSYDSPAGNAQDGYQRISQNNTAYALFGNVKYDVSPALSLRGGLRWSSDRKSLAVEAYSNSGFAPCVAPTIGIPGFGPVRCTLADLAALEPDGNLGAKPRDNKATWDLSASYKLDKDTNLYARAATGYRASSIQSASAFNTKSVAKPETNTSFEAGVKADLFNRRARANFSLFSYTVKDLQLTAVGGANNANILLNAEKATGRGFELDFQAYVTDNLLATVGLGYNDTELKTPGLAVATCGTLPNSASKLCTVRDPLTAGGQALIDGNPLPQAPKVTANVTAKYTLPLASGEAYVFTDWVYRSKVNFFLYDSVEFTGKALTEGGLRVGYTWGNGKYDFAAFGRNITNKIVAVGAIDFNNLTGFINEPRTYGVQFKAAF